MRVFLIPQNESTLGHFLAMYDDLYCCNVYNFFNSNPMLLMSVRAMGSERSNPVNRDFASCLQAILQNA